MSRRFRRAWGEDLPYYERPGTTKGDPTVWSNPVVPPMSTEIPSDVFVDGSPSYYESSDKGKNMDTRTARRIAQDSVVFVATEEDMIGVLRDMGVKGLSLVAGEDDIKWQAVFFVGAAGAGKCFGKGTEILMADGSVKNVEDVVDGDKVMGDDSESRIVIETHVGSGPLYRVVPTKGVPFVVSGNHTLIFQKLSSQSRRIGDKKVRFGYHHEDVEIDVEDFISSPNTLKKSAKLFHVPVEYPHLDVPFPPYILGMWLGDGNAENFAITTMDGEVEKEFRDYVSSVPGMKIRVDGKHDNKAKTITGSVGRKRVGDKCFRNPVITILRDMGAMSLLAGRSNYVNKKRDKSTKMLRLGKRIPSLYLRNDSQTRLELLAGLLDTDGYLNKKCFYISQVRKELSEDIAILAGSLGFAVNKSVKIINGTSYYGISICGDVDRIPTRIPRKQSSQRRQKKNVLHTGFVVEPYGSGRYFGFEVDGNHRHLLADFTVVHNSYYNSKTYLKHTNFKLIDPDEVKKRHPDYDPERPYKLHEWSKEVSDNEFEQVVSSGDGDPVVVDGTGRDAEGIARKMELAKRNGYRTFLVYVWVPIEVSIFRNRNRSRFVPEKKIMDSFYEIERSFYKLRGMVDKYKVVLNSSSSDFAEAKADVDTYPPPQAVRPPRPGDADYGLARAANCRIGRIAAKVAAVRIGGQGGQV